MLRLKLNHVKGPWMQTTRFMYGDIVIVMTVDLFQSNQEVHFHDNYSIVSIVIEALVT